MAVYRHKNSSLPPLFLVAFRHSGNLTQVLTPLVQQPMISRPSSRAVFQGAEKLSLERCMAVPEGLGSAADVAGAAHVQGAVRVYMGSNTEFVLSYRHKD